MIQDNAGCSVENDIVVCASNLTKYYGSFVALKDVSLELRKGEVHILLGENGAGKSTFVNLLIGAIQPDEGMLLINGVLQMEYTPLRARAAGVNAVLQDYSLAPAMTVAENFFLGRELCQGPLLSKAAMQLATKAALQKYEIGFDVNQPVSDLSRPEQQLLEIVKALGGRPGVLILDEPTASLSHNESEKLFAIVESLRLQRWSILYITHRMEEIRRLGDRVTVIRDGKTVAAHIVAYVADETLIEEMIGRPLERFYPHIEGKPGASALALNGASALDRSIQDVSVNLNYGEIVGVGGLVGCGKGDIGRVLFGLKHLGCGSIVQDGEQIWLTTPRDALRRGIIYLPQDRRGEALAPVRSIGENITLEVVQGGKFTRWTLLRKSLLKAFASKLMHKLDIRPQNLDKPVQELSGGNQQKVLLARAVSKQRHVYIFDEPTAGIDVGARLDFYNELKKLCEDGAAILLISSDLQELIHLSHRIYVMHDGNLNAELTGSDMTEQNVARAAFGEGRLAA